MDLPHIGYGIAGALREMLVTGRWGQLDRQEGRRRSGSFSTETESE